MNDDKVIISRRALERLVALAHADAHGMECPTCPWWRDGESSEHADDCAAHEALVALRPEPAPVPDEDHAPQPHTLDLAAEVVMLLQRVTELEAEAETRDAQVTNRLAEMETRITRIEKRIPTRKGPKP